MAISLELACVLTAMCDYSRPARVVDFGSGFSSYVFGLYAERAAQKVEVWSIDDDGGWLDKTGSFLASRRLPPHPLVTWESFMATRAERFDLVLHDLASDPLRSEALPAVFSCVSPGGLIILDDIQKREYRQAIERCAARLGWQAFSLLNATKDQFGRHSMLVIRPG